MDPLEESEQHIYVDEFDEERIRKPYTITKSRESWTNDEHSKFMEALTK